MHIDIAKLKSMSMMGGLYILDELRSRTTSNGKPFVSGRLSDASGSIDLVMWDNCPLSGDLPLCVGQDGKGAVQ